MSKKRKSDANRLEEMDRTLYSTFRGAANALSQLYTQAMAHQKLAFQDGERHALEKLYQWFARQHQEGARVTIADIVGYIQNELENSSEDPSVSTRVQQFAQQPQSSSFGTNSGFLDSSNFVAQAALGTPRSGNLEQVKNSIFSNALSSPVRRSLQPFHLAQGGDSYPNSVSPFESGRNQDINSPRLNRDDTHSPTSNDFSMDMHYSD